MSKGFKTTPHCYEQ